MAAGPWLAAAGGRAFAAEEPGLRALSLAKKVPFGVGIDLADTQRPDIVALLKRHAAMIVPRNALKWTVTERVRGGPDYRGADRIIAFARELGCLVYGHTLIWYHAPGWVQAIGNADELRTAMRDRIAGAMARYKGTIHAWDVVNEPLLYSEARLRDSVFQRLLGEDHIRIAFEMAAQADPAAHLVLNETHLEKAGPMYDARRALFLDLVERLRKQGTPIHSVGLQGHFRPGLDDLDDKALGHLCRSLKSMGIGVRITELDGSCRFTKRLRGETADASHARVFRDFVAVTASEGRLESVTSWGIAEKYEQSEVKTPRNQNGDGKPEGDRPKPVCHSRVLLYDDDMRPRPTLDALMRAYSVIEKMEI